MIQGSGHWIMEENPEAMVKLTMAEGLRPRSRTVTPLILRKPARRRLASIRLRFTDVLSSDVKAIRDGEDLILEIRGRTNTIRLTDQFLGENNELLSNGKRMDSGVSAIVFADGVAWDRFRMSMEVLDKDRARLAELDEAIAKLDVGLLRLGPA